MLVITGYSSCLARIHETFEIFNCMSDLAYCNRQCTDVIFIKQHCASHYV